MKTSNLIKKLNKSNNIKPDICKITNISPIREDKIEESIIETQFPSHSNVLPIDSVTESSQKHTIIYDDSQLNNRIDNLIEQQINLNSLIKEQDKQIQTLKQQVNELTNSFVKLSTQQGFFQGLIKKWL